MKTKIVTYLSIVCLLLVIVAQAYIVYDHFRVTEDSLRREVNAVIDDAYHIELNLRDKSQKSQTGNNNIIIPPPSDENTSVYNFDNMSIDKNDAIELMNRAIEAEISKKRPLNIRNLDSVTAEVLKTRSIVSDFVVCIVNPQTDKIIESSKKTFENSRFLLKSKYLPLDFNKQKSLQLVLLNPMTNIFKRMGSLLAGSLILSLICLYGLWFLFLTLSRQKQLIAVKNDFFGHTAHELKRPVAQLYMALDALSRPSIDGNKLKKERYLAISKEATRDMSEKIGMIMTLSMAEEGVFRLNYTEFDLIELITNLKEKFTDVAEKTVSIQFENSVQNVMVKADKDHIRQTIANLIDNAIKYSKESVQITITIQQLKKDLLLCVKDNGIGIAPDKIDCVFEKYTRINSAPGAPSGFGIGLSYVKAVIEKHAGRIEVVSELTKGSEFRVFLPAYQ
ncbi:MAG: HAMP domain-containing sensor histidine kinase [Bacteroidales bacterium]